MNASVNTSAAAPGNASVAEFLTMAAHQAHGNYGNLTLLWFNATVGAIFIDPSITNVSVLNPAIGDLFAPDIFSVPQACAYPISGMRDDPCFFLLFCDC